MEEVSYQNHIVSSNIFQIIWPKYVNLMNFRFYRISLYWLRWSACHEGVLMSDDLMKMKILWILVVILSQPMHCLSSESSPQHLTAILWLISLGWSSWLQGSSSHSGSMFFFIYKIQVDQPHHPNRKYK